MKTAQKTFFSLLVLSLILVIAGLSICLLTTQSVFAEESTSGVIENTSGVISNDTKYENAKEQANKIVEEIGLRDYLIKYFDENMTDLIITITVVVLASILFLGAVFINIKGLLTTIKKFGVESDATKEVARELKKQLSSSESMISDMKNTLENSQLVIEELTKKMEKLQKALVLISSNNSQLIENGTADKVKEVVNGDIEEV